ncbi:hypothetical protein LCGC14_3044280, partial [marine sediment metagenome]
YIVYQEQAAAKNEQDADLEGQVRVAVIQEAKRHNTVAQITAQVYTLETVSQRVSAWDTAQQALIVLENAEVPEQLIEEQVTARLALELLKYTQLQKARTAKAASFRDKLFAELRHKVAAAQTQLKQLQSATNPHEGPLNDAATLLAANRTQHTTAQDEITVAEDAVAVYDYWRTGFSKQGIQSLLVAGCTGSANS